MQRMLNDFAYVRSDSVSAISRAPFLEPKQKQPSAQAPSPLPAPVAAPVQAPSVHVLQLASAPSSVAQPAFLHPASSPPPPSSQPRISAAPSINATTALHKAPKPSNWNARLSLPLDIPYAWEALLAGARSRKAPQKAAASATLFCEAGLTLVFLIAAASFAKKARAFVHQKIAETGCSEWPPVPHRDSTFHSLACASALCMAMAHALVVADVRSPGLVPWRYNGRVATSALLAVSLGYINGKQMSDICPALALAAGAWAQLGAAEASIAEPALHWGLACSGVFMGGVALNILYGFVEQSLLLDVEQISRRDMIDLALFCNLGYLLLWLTEAYGTQEVTTTTRVVDTLLTGTVDVIYAWGINHLLIKREELLDTVCCHDAKAAWAQKEAPRL